MNHGYAILLAAAAHVFIAVGSMRASPILALTAKGDPIIGIWDTTIGGNDVITTQGLGAGQYNGGERPANAIDQDTSSKYLNFGNGSISVTSTTKGVGTGFYVTPVIGSSIVSAIKVATANDFPNRDPLTVSLEGSNATGAPLDLGSSWTVIQSSINLGIDADPGRNTFGPLVMFANATPYTSYRVLVQSQRGLAEATQYSEMNLFGIATVPEPSAIMLSATGLLSLLIGGIQQRSRDSRRRRSQHTGIDTRCLTTERDR